MLIAPSYPASTYVVSQTPIFATLACDAGSWQSSTPMTVAVSWVRGGAVVSTSPTYSVISDDLRLGIPTCRVDATNAAGTTTTNLPAVPVLATDTRSAAYAVYGGALLIRVDKTGHAHLAYTCLRPGPTGCRGSLELRRDRAIIGHVRFAGTTPGRQLGLVSLATSTRRLAVRRGLLDATLTLRNDSGAYTTQQIVLDARP